MVERVLALPCDVDLVTIKLLCQCLLHRCMSQLSDRGLPPPPSLAANASERLHRLPDSHPTPAAPPAFWLLPELGFSNASTIVQVARDSVHPDAGFSSNASCTVAGFSPPGPGLVQRLLHSPFSRTPPASGLLGSWYGARGKQDRHKAGRGSDVNHLLHDDFSLFRASRLGIDVDVARRHRRRSCSRRFGKESASDGGPAGEEMIHAHFPAPWTWS